MPMYPANVGQYFGNGVPPLPPGAGPNLPPHGFAAPPVAQRGGGAAMFAAGGPMPNVPPPPYSQQHAQAYEMRQREEEARRLRLIEEEQKRRQREATRQRLMQVGRQGGVSVDALIRNIVGPTPARQPAARPAPASASTSGDDFADFQSALSPSQAPAPAAVPSPAPAPAPSSAPAPAPAQQKPDLNSFMMACSDLSAPSKAKHFAKEPRARPQAPAATAIQPQSQKAGHWDKLSNQLDGMFVLNQPESHIQYPPHQQYSLMDQQQYQQHVRHQQQYQQQLEHQQQLELQYQHQLELQYQQQRPEESHREQQKPQESHREQQRPQESHHHEQQPHHQEGVVQNHPPHSQQPERHQFPSWAMRHDDLPVVYTQLYQAAVREGDRLDTAFLYNVFLTSGLSVEQLGRIWSVANRTLPGELLRPELNVALALIGLAQVAGQVELPARLDQLEGLRPIPDPVFMLANGTKVGGTGPPASEAPRILAPALSEPGPTLGPTSAPSLVPTAAPPLIPTATPAAPLVPTATPAPPLVPTASPAPPLVPTSTPAPSFVPTSTPAPALVPTSTPAPALVPTSTPGLAPLSTSAPGPTPSPVPAAVSLPAPATAEAPIASSPGGLIPGGPTPSAMTVPVSTTTSRQRSESGDDFGTFQVAPSTDDSDKYQALRVLAEPEAEVPAALEAEGGWGIFSAAAEAPGPPTSGPADLLSGCPEPAAAAISDGGAWSALSEPQSGGGADAWANFSTAFNSQLKIIDLTQTDPPAGPGPGLSSAPQPTPAPLGPPKLPRARKGAKTGSVSAPRSAVRIAEDIELPPSEEKHDFMDQFVREDFGAILTSSSASTSEDYAELSSQASYEATTSSSPSSTSASPHHVTSTAPAPAPIPTPAAAPAPKMAPSARRMDFTSLANFKDAPAAAPDLAWRDEPPPLDCVEEDDFGDFQAGSAHVGIADDLASPCAALPPPPSLLAPGPAFASSLSLGASETASLEGGTSVKSLELRPSASVKSLELAPTPSVKSCEDQSCEEEERAAPASAASVMADAVALGASDRYSSIAGGTVDLCDQQFVLWQRCLTAAQEKFEASSAVFGEASGASLLSEMVATQKARAHLEALVEIYVVTRRVAAACQVFSFVRQQDASTELAQLDTAWQRLLEFIKVADVLLPDISISSCAQLVSGRPEQKEPSEPKSACGVCLNELGEPGEQLSFAGRTYHPACANFWVNCVDATLPSFAPPCLL